METHHDCHSPPRAALDNRVHVIFMTVQGKQFGPVNDGQQRLMSENTWALMSKKGGNERKGGSQVSLKPAYQLGHCPSSFQSSSTAIPIISKAQNRRCFLCFINPLAIHKGPDYKKVKTGFMIDIRKPVPFTVAVWLYIQKNVFIVISFWLIKIIIKNCQVSQ